MSAVDLYVLDASAVLAHLERGRGHERVFSLLEAARTGQARLIISDINLGEIYYVIKRQLGQAAADEMLIDLGELQITPVGATWERVRQAANLKAEGRLSYADCFAATLTAEMDAVLVTGDADFEKVQDQIEVEWL